MNQENKPLVTAVVPVYNHENYVVESIRSILNQTYPNIELIVINDGSKAR
jgi:alpha-1,3-rhamnosyltransferase